jgi:hypothetical protein
VRRVPPLCWLLWALPAALPLHGQQPRAAWVEAAGLVMHQPRWTSEPVTRVRTGTGGRDVAYTAEAGARITGGLGAAFTLHVAPTRQFWWQGRAVRSGAGWKPAPAAAAPQVYSTPLTWSCATFSAVYQYRTRVAASGGAGLCGMSGIDYLWWGAGPMYSEALHVSGRFYQPVARGLDVSARCDAHRVNFGSPRFAVVKLWAGEQQGRLTQGAVTPVSCGVGLRWKTGMAEPESPPVTFSGELGQSAFIRSGRGLQATFAPMFAVGTRLQVGGRAVALRLRGSTPRFDSPGPAAAGHDARFHQLTLAGEYGARLAGEFLNVSGQLGLWTAGARDWEVWREGFTAGPLVGAGVDVRVLQGQNEALRLGCSAQLLAGGAPASVVVPCGLSGEIGVR